MTMTIQQLIEKEGGISAFSQALSIPKRTVENWRSEAAGGRRPPEYNVHIYAELLSLRKKLKCRKANMFNS